MTKLQHQDRKRLISILERWQLFGDYESRRQILISAGLQDIIPQIDLHGSPFIASSKIVEALELYGKSTAEEEALGRLLNRLKELIGAHDETQAFLDELLFKYHLMLPIKTQKEPTNWRIDTASESVFEKIIGENTLRDIAFLKRGFEAGRSVGYVEVPNRWTGTGFLISPNLLITNNHVIPDIESATQAIFRFNYQVSFGGAMEIVEDFKARDKGVFFHKCGARLFRD